MLDAVELVSSLEVSVLTVCEPLAFVVLRVVTVEDLPPLVVTTVVVTVLPSVVTVVFSVEPSARVLLVVPS